MTSRKAGCLLQVQKRMWAMRHVLLTVLMSGPIPALAAAADGSANDATNTYTTPTPAGSQALHQMFTVIGGKDMEALKCSTPQRRKTPERKPTPTVNDSQRQDPAPAGSDEEIIPLTEAEERVMLKKALAPPSTNDLRRNLPKIRMDQKIS